MTLQIPPQPATTPSSLEASGGPATSREDARHRLHLLITGLQAVLEANPTDDLSARIADRHAQAELDARAARLTSHAPPLL